MTPKVRLDELCELRHRKIIERTPVIISHFPLKTPSHTVPPDPTTPFENRPPRITRFVFEGFPKTKQEFRRHHAHFRATAIKQCTSSQIVLKIIRLKKVVRSGKTFVDGGKN
jgi:hypothetical protein